MMKSSTGVILFGTFLQVLVFTGQALIYRLFSSVPTLTPFIRFEVAVTFIISAFVSIAIGLWFARSRPQAVLARRSQSITSGAVATATSSLFGILVGILILLFLSFGDPSIQDTLQSPGRGVFLLNMALISINPLCSGILISVVFGGLGGFMAKSLRSEGVENDGQAQS